MNMQAKEEDIKRMMVWLLAISAVIRGVLAAWLEFGNDEAYYWTYALYPDWSHFDHPPMVGWVIQLFSLNLLFDSELFIRLASVVFMTANTYIIYRIGKEIKDARTGFFAALLYTASVYSFVITGIFIMPDTPLMLFWTLAFWMAVKYFKEDQTPWRNKRHSLLLLFGLFGGLAMLSKYSGIFLWVGLGLYVIAFDRKQLNNPYLYCSLVISLLCCIPIIYWNVQNGFISFSFHGDRVRGETINFGSLGTELAGEFLYNNPVNFVLAIMAVIAAFKGSIGTRKTAQRLVLCTSLPLIMAFLGISMTRPTLPHWNAPAYNLLIILTAYMLSNNNPSVNGVFRLPKSIIAAIGVMLFIVVVGSLEIKTGFIPLDRHTEPEMLGRDDFTLDMYGWRQLGKEFAVLREQKIADGTMKAEAGIVADEWFPLANLDYYVARPLNMKTMGFGWVHNLHKYLWINEKRG